MSINVEKLLREARAMGGDDDNGGRKRTKNDMTEQQQADQLRDALAAYANPHPFNPGDYVRYRSDCNSYIRNGSRLHVVLERISPPLKPDAMDDPGSNIAYRQYDVILAVTDAQEKGGVLKYIADSRELELWPDGDRLKREHS